MDEVKAEVIDLVKLIRLKADSELASDLEPIIGLLAAVIDNHGLAREDFRAILDAIYEGLSDFWDDA